jgi:hypothetical protein
MTVSYQLSQVLISSSTLKLQYQYKFLKLCLFINCVFYLQPSQFESKVQEVVQLVKESVLVGEQRETSLLENSNAQRELSALVQGLLLSFSQVCFL